MNPDDKPEMKGILKRKGKRSVSKDRKLSWGGNEFKNFMVHEEITQMSATKTHFHDHEQEHADEILVDPLQTNHTMSSTITKNSNNQNKEKESNNASNSIFKTIDTQPSLPANFSKKISLFKILIYYLLF